MIRPFWDCYLSLSKLHRLVVVVTIVLPVAVPTFLRYFSVENLWLLIAMDLVAISVWFLVVVVVVALLIRYDSAAARQLVESRVHPLEGQVDELEDEHRRAIRGVRTDFLELERRTRSAIEDLGGSLPPRDVSLSASIRAGEPRVSADLRVSNTPPLGLWAGLTWWFGRAQRSVWRAIRRVIWDYRQGWD